MNAREKFPLPYDWPCRGIVPAEKQMLTTAFMVYNPHSFVLNDPGTGKTLAALWAADFLMSQYERYSVRAIILSPLSTLTQVWKKEIYTHFLGRRSSVVVHGTLKQRMKALETKADFYIMNFDGVKVPQVFNKILSMAKIKIGIVDESTAFKNNSSKRTKKAKILLHHRPYLWLMSGTPTPQDPLDAHGQAALCHATYVETKTAFKGRVKQQVAVHKFISTEDAYDKARQILQPAIRIPRRDFHDLPPSIPVPYKVPFSPEQQKVYNELKKEMKSVLAANNGEINAVHEGALRLKLLQVAAGAVYDKNKKVHVIDASPRIHRLREVINECPDKLLVFASFTSVLTMLHERFKKEVSCALVTGATSRKARDKIFADFQQEDEPKVIFADPGTMSHGLTLTRATVSCWYGPTDRNEVYTQANYRIDRPGKTKDTYTVQLGGCKVEWEIYDRLEKRQSMQGVMLKLMEASDE